jgi:hypothetical protein
LKILNRFGYYLRTYVLSFGACPFKTTATIFFQFLVISEWRVLFGALLCLELAKADQEMAAPTNTSNKADKLNGQAGF